MQSGRGVQSAGLSERVRGMKDSYVGEGWMWGSETTMSVEKVDGRRAGAGVRKTEWGMMGVVKVGPGL